MHVIMLLLSALGGLAWVIYYLQRDGFDFSSLNPFLWKRRAHWRNRYETDPLHSLDKPLEVAAVLMVGIAKETGDIALEEKQKIKALMSSELKRSAQQADELYVFSTHLLRERKTLVPEIPRVVQRSKDVFSEEQVRSIDALLTEIAELHGQPSQRQQQFIEAFRAQFDERFRQQTWA